jgi:DNA-binding IclR family transcriptional regulator
MKQKTIQSVSRALKIIEVLAGYPEGIALNDLSQKLDLKKSTLHHLIITLVVHNYVKQNPLTRKYIIGSKIFEINNQISSTMDSFNGATPILMELANKCGEVVHLVKLDDGEVIYQQKIESPNCSHGLRMASYVGMRNCAHSSSGGKVLLAYLEKAQLKSIIESKGLPQLTKNTITDPNKLLSNLQTIRDQGYAIDDEENEIGVRCLGAPIKNASGNVVKAISISGPSSRITKDIIRYNLIQLVKEAAEHISDILGHRENR